MLRQKKKEKKRAPAPLELVTRSAGLLEPACHTRGASYEDDLRTRICWRLSRCTQFDLESERNLFVGKSPQKHNMREKLPAKIKVFFICSLVEKIAPGPFQRVEQVISQSQNLNLQLEKRHGRTKRVILFLDSLRVAQAAHSHSSLEFRAETTFPAANCFPRLLSAKKAVDGRQIVRKNTAPCGQ